MSFCQKICSMNSRNENRLMTRKKNELNTDEIGTFFKEIIMAATGCTILFVGSLPGAFLITE